ncbi:MAG: hypothetical protein U1A22_12500, partial [Xanthomonadaceae bacterium]|nr:hypothetical protein [Xanthomonadaceae bacterium]
MNTFNRGLRLASAGILLAFASNVDAFDSGSTGADGAFNPTVDRVVPLPDDGVFNFTSVNIPAGVTVRFERNTLNTPVRILVSGNATIDGVIDVSGQPSAPVGTAGDGVIADDGLPGLGGPGGFDGGRGGVPGTTSGVAGAQGIGPGGGFPAVGQTSVSGVVYGCGGAGGGYSSNGGTGGYIGPGNIGACATVNRPAGGSSYGNERLLPLIGGSGGGGGSGGQSFAGSGGGGGGGGILVAVSGTLTVTGTIRANGGRAGLAAGSGTGAIGGGGSGGSIRLIASALAGNGALTATGGLGATSEPNIGGPGAVGRIRLEAETMTRTAGTTPQFSFAAPGPVFLAGMPSLRIESV